VTSIIDLRQNHRESISIELAAATTLFHSGWRLVCLGNPDSSAQGGIRIRLGRFQRYGELAHHARIAQVLGAGVQGD
jgi:hypothetical protein